jgi:hypothetical protein
MLSFTELAVTEAEADAYFEASDDQVWQAAAGDRAGALMRGQRYIAGLYNQRWSVPFDSAAAPDAVKFAIMEAGKAELVQPGSLTTAAPLIKRKREKVEGIERETEYQNGARADGNTSGAEAIISGLLAGLTRSASTAWLLRA